MDKLQELTQKLYNEGLSKGKEEGQALLTKAQAQADAIIAKAREEAAAIAENARKEADAYRIKVEGDVKMAAMEALQTTRSQIEDLIVTKATAPVSGLLSEETYLKEIITAVAQRFNADESQELSLVLPESLRAQLEPFVTGELSKLVGKGVEAQFSKKIAGGLRIGPKDGSYYISLTDESFRELIGAYLRPATKKILFG